MFHFSFRGFFCSFYIILGYGLINELQLHRAFIKALYNLPPTHPFWRTLVFPLPHIISCKLTDYNCRFLNFSQQNLNGDKILPNRGG